MAGSTVIPGDLTINNGTVTMTTIGGQIAPTSHVALNGGSVLNLVGSNKLTTVSFNDIGGNGVNAGIANPTVNINTTTVVAAIANGTNVVRVPNTSGLVVGQTITGTGVPAGTTITAIDPVNNQITGVRHGDDRHEPDSHRRRRARHHGGECDHRCER
ncbi:MAG: hypothetical protein WDN28_13130 [Chthoniobacter sp.]